jgi:hypothetical protein
VEAPRPKKWGIGVQVGAGIASTSITGLKTTITPYIGIGISYNFIRW